MASREAERSNEATFWKEALFSNEDNGASRVGEVMIGGINPDLFTGIEEVFSTRQAGVNDPAPLVTIFPSRTLTHTPPVLFSGYEN
jgi:hypothetical protein